MRPVPTLALLLAAALSPGFSPARAARATVAEEDPAESPDARGLAEILFARGRLAWVDADAETALTLFDRAATIWPQDATYIYFAGHAALRLRRTGEAVEKLSRALPPARSRIPEWRLRSDVGMALYLNGESRAAEAPLRRAVELNPGDAAAWFHLGLVLLDLGKPAESVGMFERARRLAPVLTADAHYYAGVAAFRQGELDTARREFHGALDSASRRVRHSIPEALGDARAYLEILEGSRPVDDEEDP